VLVDMRAERRTSGRVAPEEAVCSIQLYGARCTLYFHTLVSTRAAFQQIYRYGSIRRDTTLMAFGFPYPAPAKYMTEVGGERSTSGIPASCTPSCIHAISESYLNTSWRAARISILPSTRLQPASTPPDNRLRRLGMLIREPSPLGHPAARSSEAILPTAHQSADRLFRDQDPAVDVLHPSPAWHMQEGHFAQTFEGGVFLVRFTFGIGLCSWVGFGRTLAFCRVG